MDEFLFIGQIVFLDPKSLMNEIVIFPLIWVRQGEERVRIRDGSIPLFHVRYR